MVYVNPVIFVVGAVMAFWSGGPRGVLTGAGCYLLTFAIVWEVGSNWYGFSIEHVLAGLVTVAVVGSVYLLLAAAAAFATYVIQRVWTRRQSDRLVDNDSQ